MVTVVPLAEVGRGGFQPDTVVVASTLPLPISATSDPGEICVAKLASLVTVIARAVIWGAVTVKGTEKKSWPLSYTRASQEPSWLAARLPTLKLAPTKQKVPPPAGHWMPGTTVPSGASQSLVTESLAPVVPSKYR